METITLYHNPRCSKSRETLALIRTAGIEPCIVEYLDAPLSHVELESLLSALQLPVSGLMRTGDALYAELALDASDCTDEMRLDALQAHPLLFNRPVAVGPLGARICRPPEMVLEILPVQ
ncbi:MAG TPA: arsenate reductase (glutaredoxin) [Arenimonas sp.]|nr:arsenate reductase (glutaredoxin) [Arenimonas sp.]